MSVILCRWFRGLLAAVVIYGLAACAALRPPAQTEFAPTQTGTVLLQATDTPDLQSIEKTLEPKQTATLSQQLSELSVVYVKDGDLWHWSRSGKNKLTGSGDVHQPRLSPDGKIVAFLRPAGDFYVQLWAIDISAENERLLVSIEDLNTIGGGVTDPSAVAVIPYQFEWVPGTHLLAFNTQQVFQGPGLSLLDDFHLVDADSLELKFVLLPGWGGVFSLSPDGKKVALSTSEAVSLANLDGTDYLRVMTYSPIVTYSDYRYYVQPVWSTNSQELRAAIPPVDPLAEPAGPTSIWVIPTDGSLAVQTGSVNAVSFIESAVAFSPDLQYLAYLKESGAPDENLREIYLAKSDGSEARLYQKDRLLRFEGWSVNPRGFFFTTGEDQQFWYGQVDAPAQILAGDPYNLSAIRWVDLQNYLFARQVNTSFDLYLGEVDGQVLLIEERISTPPEFDFYPRFTNP